MKNRFLLAGLMLLLSLSLSAQGGKAVPVKPVHKAPQLTPIQRTVLAAGDPDAYYQFTTPTDFVALQYGGGTGDYVLFLYDANNQPVAQLSIKTASDNSLAGTYTLGTYGGQSKISALYQGNNTLTVEYGVVSLKYKGQLPTTKEDIYEIVASQLLVAEGEKIISYSFAGTIVGLAAWKDYYIDCNKNGQNCDKARITLNESPVATVAEVTCFEPEVDRTHISTDQYWTISGSAYDAKSNYTVTYSATVSFFANGTTVEGAYGTNDVVNFVDDNEQNLYGAFLSKSTDYGNTWADIDVKAATATVTKTQNNVYQYDIYITDNSNKVYHFSMLENVNTSNPLVYYDSPNDFYAAFASENVTPFTGEYVGQEGNNYFTIVEAYDTHSGNYAYLKFYANRVDDVIRIPEGRYTFASNKSANTIEAAYMTIDNQGNITSKGGAWVASNSVVQGGQKVSGEARYIVSGTADVKKNSDGTMYIEVNGTNSLGRTICFTIGIPSSSSDYILNVTIEGEGKIVGAGWYKKDEVATLTAIPAYGYTFKQWSDGNTDNPRQITMTQDVALTAIFEIPSGTCGAEGDNLTWQLSLEGVLTISGTGEMENWSNESAVPWYKNRESIVSIVIEKGTTSIGGYAFSGCSSLTSVTIPNSMDTIRNDAFANCSALSSVNISDLAAWCRIWFGNLNSNPLYNAHHLYLDKKEITELEIPKSVTSIEWGAFCGCSYLTSVTIPNGVTKIATYAFKDCIGLTSVTIPESVQNTGGRPFDNCTGLTSVIWNAVKDTTYDDGQYIYPPFQNCPNITSFTIGNQVEELPRGLCYGLPIETIDIPNSVTSIGVSAFRGCESLATITIPKDVKTIGAYTFKECTNLTTIVWNVTSCDNPESYQYSPFYDIRSQITSFTFGEDVETIPSYLCYGMSKLKSVTIPKNVKTISAFAFNECANLTTIIWNAKSYDELDSFVHSPFYGIRSLITSFTFGNDVETIPAYLCYEMSNLTSVTIGNNVKIVGEHAFEKCAKLESVPIGNSVTNIEEYAFYDCSSLTSIEIPNSVTHIGVYAFRNCISLTSVTIPNSVISIGGSAFSGCSGLTSITIGNSLTNVGNQAFEGCNSLTSVHIRDLAVWCGIVFNDPFANPLYYAHHLYLNDKIVTKLIIPDNVASIGDCTFTYCADLTSVTIPNSVTHIGVYAFGFCSGLTSVTIPNSVTSIGDAAFVYCSGLTSVTIPNSVTSIGLGAFGYCSSLTSVTIPDGVTSIENHTFEGCSSLTSITIPNSVTSVGERAFYGCSGLTSLTIGISVADIGEEAFAECTNFDWITCYASTVPNITSSTFENIGNKKYIYLYVPENRQRAYLRNEYWGE